MQTVLEKLIRQSYLFDDPRTYQAGVEDALAELRGLGLLDVVAPGEVAGSGDAEPRSRPA